MPIFDHIKKLADYVRTKQEGWEVRESFAKSMEETAKSADATEELSKETQFRQDVVVQQFDDQIKNMTLDDPSSAEMVAMRTSRVTGKNYNTAGDRADDADRQLAHTLELIGPLDSFDELLWVVPDIAKAIRDLYDFQIQNRRNVKMPPYNAAGDGLINDSPMIQRALDEAGINETIFLPKPPLAYRIETPITFKVGQTIECASGTFIRDYTDDYCFKMIGGSVFADQAVKNTVLRNADIIDKTGKSKGAVKIKNGYIIDLEFLKLSGYTNTDAKVIHIDDFFQINLKTVQINANPNGHGIFVDAHTGNSGQLNLYSTIVQRCKIGMEIVGTGNLIDGVSIYGGAFGNNYKTGLKIGKNVYNVTCSTTHFENHDTDLYSGDTAVDLMDVINTDGITFLNCFFINNKFGIKSNGAKRVTIMGTQFDGRGIAGSVAIWQGNNDVGWVIMPCQFMGNGTDVMPDGSNHLNMNRIKISSEGVIFPQRTDAGVYSGAGSPDGRIEAEKGSIYLRTDGETHRQFYTKVSGSGRTGWRLLVQHMSVFTDATRPSPSEAGAGAAIYNTGDKMPNYSDGTVWRDAAGNLT